MISSLKVHNYKNLSEKKLIFEKNIVLFFGENTKGKSSLLEALCLIGNEHLVALKSQEFIKNEEEECYIEITSSGNTLSYAASRNSRAKNFKINGRKVSRKDFRKTSPRICFFKPMSMNLLFESPSRKRDFLNEILSSSFDGYGPVHSHYQKILKNRNAILKNISKGRGQEKELDYWDTEFCNACVEVYRYRYLLVEFFKKNMSSLYAYFSQNDILISFNYINKCGFKNVGEYLLDYLRSNRERDIILQRTSIGAHLDDFEININTQSVESYCSRGEIKSIIIGLKMLECKFIEEHCDNHIILLIDDLESELDQKRLAQLLSSFGEYQTFLTNISPLKKSEIQQIKLV